MKYIEQYIKEELIKLSERRYEAPSEILDVLKDKLKLNPLVRYIKHLKAVNSIPPSYRVFLHNDEFFDIIYEDFSLLAKIGPKEYFLNDIDEKNYAIKDINRLLTTSKVKPEEEDLGGEDIPPPPPPPPGADDTGM
jgi:hypothetical protein